MKSSDERRLQRNYFEKVAGEYMNRYRSLYWVLYLTVFQSWFSCLSPQMKLLDLGCGTAHLSSEMASFVDYVVGLDISPSMIREAKKRQTPKNIDLIVGDAENLPLRTTCFEAVIVSGFLHHTKYLEKCIREISRILKLEGIFYALEPNREAFQGSILFYESFFPLLKLILPLWREFNRGKILHRTVKRHSGLILLSPNSVKRLLASNKMTPKVRTMMFPLIPVRILCGCYYSAMAKAVILVNIVFTGIFDVLPLSKQRGNFLVIESKRKGNHSVDY